MMLLSHEKLVSVLHYDETTGQFLWLIKPSTRVNIGDKAGRVTNTGYRQIKISKISYYAHRLAWLYVHKVFPPALTDHINGNRLDNRICNLRLCGYRENAWNRKTFASNTSGYTGVSFQRNASKWEAYIGGGDQRRWLGFFPTAFDAHSAYVVAARELFGEFAPR